MEIGMKMSHMAKVHKFIRMVIDTLAVLKKVSKMVKILCLSGQTIKNIYLTEVISEMEK